MTTWNEQMSALISMAKKSNCLNEWMKSDLEFGLGYLYPRHLVELNVEWGYSNHWLIDDAESLSNFLCWTSWLQKWKKILWVCQISCLQRLSGTLNERTNIETSERKKEQYTRTGRLFSSMHFFSNSSKLLSANACWACGTRYRYVYHTGCRRERCVETYSRTSTGTCIFSFPLWRTNDR